MRSFAACWLAARSLCICLWSPFRRVLTFALLCFPLLDFQYHPCKRLRRRRLRRESRFRAEKIVVVSAFVVICIFIHVYGLYFWFGGEFDLLDAVVIVFLVVIVVDNVGLNGRFSRSCHSYDDGRLYVGVVHCCFLCHSLGDVVFIFNRFNYCVISLQADTRQF